MVIERYIDLAVVWNLIVSRLKLSNVFEMCFTVLDLVDTVVIKCMPEAQECKFTLGQTDTICSPIQVANKYNLLTLFLMKNTSTAFCLVQVLVN